MTIHNISSHLLSLAVDHQINGIKRSQKSLENFITTMFKSPLAGGNKLVATISLPDGDWFFYIVQYAQDEFDYYIPDNREQEKRVIAILH